MFGKLFVSPKKSSRSRKQFTSNKGG